MTSVIKIQIFLAIFMVWANVGVCGDKSVSVHLQGPDCQRFNEIERVSGGRVRFRAGLTGPKDGRCSLELDQSANKPTDKIIHGFGGSMILIISDVESYKSFLSYAGSKKGIQSDIVVKSASLNEKIFSSPAFSVQCEVEEKVCQIVITQVESR